MVDLVLDAYRQQVVGLDFVGLAFAIQRPDPHALGPAHGFVVARNRQAAFFHLLET